MKEKSLNSYSHEDLWSSILSRNDEKIKITLETLNQETIEFVVNHLKKMATEEGWQPAQQASASFA